VGGFVFVFVVDLGADWDAGFLGLYMDRNGLEVLRMGFLGDIYSIVFRLFLIPASIPGRFGFRSHLSLSSCNTRIKDLNTT